MPVKLIAPIEETLELRRTDVLLKNAGEPTTVTVRQATQRQFEKRASTYANLVQRVTDEDPGSVEYVTRFSQIELMRIEASLTVVGCNIIGPDDEPLFRFKTDNQGKAMLMDEGAFSKAWGMLPSEVAAEIWEKVREVNLAWRPLGEVS